MSDLSQTLKAGTLLVIETGEYSDSSWHGPVRVIRDFVKADAAERFSSEWKPTEPWHDDNPRPEDFLPWLVMNGYAEAVDGVTSWHVGSYGHFEP